MSLAYMGNISNLKKKTFQPNGKSWMAFFVENLKYREKKKKNSLDEDTETEMEKTGKKSKIGIKKNRNNEFPKATMVSVWWSGRAR